MQLAMGSARALACCFRRPRRKSLSRGYAPYGDALVAAGPLPGGGAGHSTRGACATHFSSCNCIVPAERSAARAVVEERAVGGVQGGAQSKDLHLLLPAGLPEGKNERFLRRGQDRLFDCAPPRTPPTLPRPFSPTP